MATTKLSSIDFMMMDVHRELDAETVDQQTMVDKTEHVEFGDQAELEVQPAERCEFCFGPKPCELHDKVEYLDQVTRHNINPTNVIASAHNAKLKEVVIVGMREDGSEYFASSVSDGGTSMYHLQRGIHKLNRIIDGDYEDDHLGPPAA